MHGNAIFLRKRIGNNFKFFAIQANTTGCGVTKVFYMSTYFAKGGGFDISNHDEAIIILLGELALAADSVNY